MSALADLEGLLYPSHERQISEWLHREVALADDSLGKCVEIALSRLYARRKPRKVDLQRNARGRFLPRDKTPISENPLTPSSTNPSENKPAPPPSLPRDKLGKFAPWNDAPRPSPPRGEVLLWQVPIDLAEDTDLKIDLLVRGLIDCAQQDADALDLPVQYYVLRATFELDRQFHPRKIFKLTPSSSENPTNRCEDGSHRESSERAS